MNTATIKTVVDCDYLVYFDQDMNVIGYELSPDERQALSIRYHASEEATAVMPLKTIYILEVFGIHTITVWLVENSEKKGQLLFYKPSMLALAKEIAKTLDCALPIDDYSDIVTREKGMAKQLPAVLVGASKDLAPSEKILKNIPFTGWMDYYWGTPTWIEIWRARPELQRFMTGYASMRLKGETPTEAQKAQKKMDIETEELLAKGLL